MTPTEKEVTGNSAASFYQKRDQMASELGRQERIRPNEEVYSHLTAYIKEYLKKKGRNYNFILGYQKGGGIIYAKDSLDITHEIVEGLNEGI